MNEAFTTMLTFPTLPLTVVLVICVIYWLMAATGIVDAGGGADIDLDLDLGDMIDGDIGDLAEAANANGSSSSGLAAVMSRLGLSGVPFMVMLTVLTLVAWTISYYAQLWVLNHFPGLMRWLVGAGVLVGSVLLAIPVAAVVLKPIRMLVAHFRAAEKPPSIIGVSGKVISPILNDKEGRAEFSHNGSVHIYQVRAANGKSYPRDTGVVIVSRNNEHHFYNVVSQQEFEKA